MLMRTNLDRSTMLTDHKVLLLASVVLGLLCLRRIQRVRQAWQPFGNLPAHFIIVSPIGIIGRFFPRIPWVSAGADFNWRNAYERQPFPSMFDFQLVSRSILDIFAKSNSDVVLLRSLYPTSTPQLLLADATTSKVGQTSTSTRSTSLYMVLTGLNLCLGYLSKPYGIS